MTENKLVECYVCGDLKKSLQVHIRKMHQMSVEEYKQFCDSNGHPFDIGYTLAKIGFKGDHNTPEFKSAKDKIRKAIDPVSIQMDTLSNSEEEYFDKRFDILFRQADFDPALEPAVRQIVMNEINLERYQAFINQKTRKLYNATTQSKDLEAAHRVIDRLNEQNLKLMSSMGLTRKDKLSQKKHVETTPSRLITAYMEELKRLTPEERRREQEDEEDAVRRFVHNESELLKLVPTAASEEEDGESL